MQELKQSNNRNTKIHNFPSILDGNFYLNRNDLVIRAIICVDYNMYKCTEVKGMKNRKFPMRFLPFFFFCFIYRNILTNTLYIHLIFVICLLKKYMVVYCSVLIYFISCFDLFNCGISLWIFK